MDTLSAAYLSRLSARASETGHGIAKVRGLLTGDYLGWHISSRKTSFLFTSFAPWSTVHRGATNNIEVSFIIESDV